jgi:hypothetical protein
MTAPATEEPARLTKTKRQFVRQLWHGGPRTYMTRIPLIDPTAATGRTSGVAETLVGSMRGPHEYRGNYLPYL